MESMILFPVLIGVDDLSDAITDEHKKFINKMEWIKNSGNHFTKETYILNAPEFSDLKNVIDKKINEHFIEHYCPLDDLRLKITQSWVNITTKDEFHHEHSHPNSAFSAVLYLNVAEGDSIEFFAPIHSTIRFDTTKLNFVNARSWIFPVKMNQLIIFPSWLRHAVPKKEIEGQRVSLAINTFYDGNLGNISNLTALTVRC